ncbi:MAG: ABC transporter permease [Candidatus Thorarchaeota archaeon]|nr:ABC transporter permease [Candidatus Thorarchaeota archaeon]
MSLLFLLTDELRGYYRSKTMMALWIGLPAIVLIIKAFNPEIEELPVTMLASLLVTSMGGTLSAVMLATSISAEMKQRVYDLYLIRPVKRVELMLSKYLAVLLCLLVAVAIAVTMGLLWDYSSARFSMDLVIISLRDALVLTMFMLAFSCSVGVFIGLNTDSVLVAAILSIYVGGQMSALPLLMTLFITWLDPVVVTGVISTAATALVLAISGLLFERRQL